MGLKRMRTREDIKQVKSLAAAKKILENRNIEYNELRHDFEGYHFMMLLPGKNYGDHLASFCPKEKDMYIIHFE